MYDRILLKSIKVNEFRDIKPGTEIMFNEHLNVFLGINATGKSTLLLLIEAVFDGSFSFCRNENFDAVYQVDLCLAGQTYVLSLRIRTGPPPTWGSATWGDFEWGTRRLLVSGEILKDNESVVVFYTEGAESKPNGVALPPTTHYPILDILAELSTVYSRKPEQPLFNQAYDLLVSSIGRTRVVDEGLDLFRFIFSNQDDKDGLVLEIAKNAGVSDGISDWSFASSYAPISLRDVIGRALQQDHRKERLDLKAADCEAVQKLAICVGYQDAQLSFEVDRDDSGPRVLITLRRATIVFTDATRTTPGGQLSYGQKRKLAIEWALMTNENVFLGDEIANGLDHDWIRDVIATLGDRQSFLTTQSPTLLDYIPIGSPEETLRTFITFRLQSDAGGKQWMVWENLSEEGAGRVFSAYESASDTLGGILETRGFW